MKARVNTNPDAVSNPKRRESQGLNSSGGQARCSSLGEVPEWLNGTVSKTVERASVPRVRIPLSPPHKDSKLL